MSICDVKYFVMNKQTNLMKEVIVTRRPIFDRQKNVFAYELLFKPEPDQQQGLGRIQAKVEGEIDNNSSAGMDALFIAGIKKLTNGKRAVINFDRQMLLNRLHLMFPGDLLGIVIGEEAGQPANKKRQKDPDTDITPIVRELKEAGYLLIVNDWWFNEGDVELVRMADIIGVDFHSHGLQKRLALFNGVQQMPRFLAKNLENSSDFQTASEIGYHYFQGELFHQAELISVRNIPGYKTNFMRILKEIHKPAFQISQIEEILKHDVSLTYKLLRFINSAAFGLKNTVQSIRHALTLLGETEVRKWLSLIVLSGIGTDKPHELTTMAIIRAKFCEFLADALNLKSEMPAFFLMGMFSMVDAFLDRPMEDILADLPLKPEVKSALLGQQNRFRDVLNLVLDYERGLWEGVSHRAGKLKLDEQQIGNRYLDAVEWAKLL
jgi:EAL and modified HD-GYP domain-containing signal transduction protein